MGKLFEPVAGYYATVDRMAAFPAPPFGSAMSAAKLAQCISSDDDRFMSSAPVGKAAGHLWKFDLSSGVPVGIAVRHEGYTVTSGSGTPHTNLRIWDLLTSSWATYSGMSHANEFDTLIEYTFWVDPSRWIDESGYLWLLVRGHQSNAESATDAVDLYTDHIQVSVTQGRICESRNLFGQHFRAFDDGAAGDVSFERRDLPGGDWSDLTQPFTGGGNSSPAIECLPDGRLRAAYINADGDLVKAQSRDDGESWEII